MDSVLVIGADNALHELGECAYASNRTGQFVNVVDGDLLVGWRRTIKDRRDCTELHRPTSYISTKNSSHLAGRHHGDTIDVAVNGIVRWSRVNGGNRLEGHSCDRFRHRREILFRIRV